MPGRAWRPRRSVDTDDDCAYALRPPDDEHRALGATDDASGDAAHEQATNGAMPAPADHDHIGLETFALRRGFPQRVSCPATSISTSGQRRESVRRALSAAFSAPRSSAVNRIDRLYSALGFFAH